MPFLSRRRSALDVLNEPLKQNSRDTNDEQETRRPQTSGLAVPQAHHTQYARPVSVHGTNFISSRLSREVRREDVLDSPTHEQERKRSKRFSMLRTRNFSESQLSHTLASGQHADEPPPMPPLPPQMMGAPSILRMTPSAQIEEPVKERKPVIPSFLRPTSRKQSSDVPATTQSRISFDESSTQPIKKTSLRWRKRQGKSMVFDDLVQTTPTQPKQLSVPPAYGDEDDTALAVPVPRFSESSRSDGSHGSSSDHVYGSTTTHTISTHTTFFKIPRRNKNRNSLFPVPITVPPPNKSREDDPKTPPAGTTVFNEPAQEPSVPVNPLQRSRTGSSPSKRNTMLFSSNGSVSQSPLSRAFQSGQNLGRRPSQRSRNSSTSSPLQPPMRLGLRDRASTTSSFGRGSMDTPPLISGSTRNSFSTTGRSSLGGLLAFNLPRFRGDSDSKHDSQGTNSKANSFALSREALLAPDREEGEAPAKYLERLEATVPRSAIATILSRTADSFPQTVLRSYTRKFPFFGEPIDMSLRKFLLEAELPKETQQVDRVIQAFADRYHECNPGVFMSPDQAYIIAFSLMMLHTDAFNKNNKRKMQKADYVKNTSGQHVSDDVLGCLYDNICYTPFIHYDEESNINGERVLPFKTKKSKVKVPTVEGKKPTGPVDPYTLLIEQKLDTLRPAIGESITIEDPYSYLDGKQSLDVKYIQRAFTHTGTLQLISARSRPTAYEDQVKTGNPGPVETQAGIISLKVTKVGILWRKATKKKKVRSPWQEWGAILTGSQLYLFKDAHWVKGLSQQHISHQKTGTPRTPVIFKPPISDFKPDALIKTDDAVALVDFSYNKHKHAFTVVRHGGQEEVFLADSDSDRFDWLAMINYAAAFRAAGVRIRGMLGVSEDAPSMRKGSVGSHDLAPLQPTQASESGELQREVLAARRKVILQRIVTSDRELSQMNGQLEDYLRDARHLMVLAPIAQKTREDVIFGAARADANIKWIRRDIWRAKCHRDILALDVQEDGIKAATLQKMIDETAEQLEDRPVTSTRDTPQSDLVLGASESHTTALSSLMRGGSTRDAIDEYMNDVFRSPPETAKAGQSSNAWRLPPLQLDVTASERQRRESITSSTLSASAYASSRRTSASHIIVSPASQSSRVNKTPSVQDATIRPSTPEPELGATGIDLDGSTAPSEGSATRQVEVDSTPKSPESTKKRQSVRRSLQKTLRDVPSHQGSIHRHRRGNQSESTVRSAGNDNVETEQDGTPGLDRGKGRFILHGKQASVIEFGEDWPNERMKNRRDAWRKDSGERTPRSKSRHMDGAASPLVQDLTPIGDDPTDVASLDSVEAASSSANSERQSLAHNGDTSRQLADVDSDSSDDDQPFYDLLTWDAEVGKRGTIIGAPAGVDLSALSHANGGAERDDDSSASGRAIQASETTGLSANATWDNEQSHDDWLAKGFDDSSRKKAVVA